MRVISSDFYGDRVYMRTMKSMLDSSDARCALFAGGLSAALLIGAWIFQYGFGYAPCTLCYWQRYAHMAIIATSAGLLLTRGVGFVPPRAAAMILILLLLISVAFGAYHAGVELSFWEGPKACSGVGAVNIDLSDPLAGLDATIKAPSCGDVAWSFLGISMAGWNALISLLGAFGVWWLGFRDARAT